MSVLDAAVNGPFDVETDDIIAILGVGPWSIYPGFVCFICVFRSV